MKCQVDKMILHHETIVKFHFKLFFHLKILKYAVFQHICAQKHKKYPNVTSTKVPQGLFLILKYKNSYSEQPFHY
jgi:hypothetical protein